MRRRSPRVSGRRPFLWLHQWWASRRFSPHLPPSTRDFAWSAVGALSLSTASSWRIGCGTRPAQRWHRPPNRSQSLSLEKTSTSRMERTLLYAFLYTSFYPQESPKGQLMVHRLQPDEMDAEF